jgi:sodium/proline symporter
MAFRVLTPLAGSLVLVAMMSAIMSTCNSILIVVGAGFAHDVYARIFRPDAGDRHLVRVNRITVLALSLVPLYFALQKFADVQSIVVAQAKLVASFFFVPVVIGLNWRRATAPGAIAAMFSGFAACLLSEWQLQDRLAAHGLDAVEIGVSTSLVVFVIVSRFSRPVPAESLKLFFHSD